MAPRILLPQFPGAIAKRSCLVRSWSQLVQFVGGSYGSEILRITVAGTLILAAVLKLYALWFAGREFYSSFHIPVWIVQGSVLLDALLGTWLLTGLFPAVAWICSIVCFFAFLCVGLIAGLSGTTACPCFGFLSTSPWLTATMDGALVGALLLVRPSRRVGERDSTPVFNHAGLVVRTWAVLIAVSATILVFLYGILAQINANQYGSEVVALQSGADDDFSNLRLVLSPAGTSLIPRDTQNRSLNEVIRKISAQDRFTSRAVESVAPSQALVSQRAIEQRFSPIVFETHQGQIRILLGVISDISGRYYQILEGNRAPFLVHGNC